MLPPGQPTHLARTGDGTLWWVQEGDDGQDVAFALGNDGVPRATALSPARVLAAMSVRAASLTAGGTFHSLAAGHDGRIWFYFTAGAGSRAGACVGAFDPRDDSIRVILTDAQLQKTTAMGPSLVLARGTIVAAAGDSSPWLWVRHSDRSALFRIEAKTGGVSPAIDVMSATSDAPPRMTGPGLALAAAADGALLLRDMRAVALWRIDPDGRAALLHELIGLPTALSAPAGDARGRAYLIAGDAPLIPARSDQEALMPVLPVRYPALLIFEAGALRAIGGQDFTLPDELTPKEMRVRELLAESENAFVGYDEHSGALLRFRIP